MPLQPFKPSGPVTILKSVTPGLLKIVQLENGDIATVITDGGEEKYDPASVFKMPHLKTNSPDKAPQG